MIMNKQILSNDDKPEFIGKIENLSVYFVKNLNISNQDLIIGSTTNNTKFIIGRFKNIKDYEDFAYKHVINKRIRLHDRKL